MDGARALDRGRHLHRRREAGVALAPKHQCHHDSQHRRLDRHDELEHTHGDDCSDSNVGIFRRPEFRGAGAPPCAGRRRHTRGCELGRHGGAQRQRPAEAAHDAGDIRSSLTRPLAGKHRGAGVVGASAAATSPPVCSSRRCIRRACAAIAGRRVERAREPLRVPDPRPRRRHELRDALRTGWRACRRVEAALGLELRREQRGRQLLGPRRARDERSQRCGHVGRHAELALSRRAAAGPGSSSLPAPVQAPWRRLDAHAGAAVRRLHCATLAPRPDRRGGRAARRTRDRRPGGRRRERAAGRAAADRRRSAGPTGIPAAASA